MSSLSNRFSAYPRRWAPLAALLGVLAVRPAVAQVAVVTAIQHVVEKRSGDNGPWVQVGPGAKLGVGDYLRTGKRSKADVKFPTGLRRLGQLSSIEVRSATSVTVTGGELLTVATSPCRVLAGTGEAEVTGSILLSTLNDDGSAEFSNLGGVSKVLTAKALVPLPTGTWVTVNTDGTLSSIKPTAPFRFLNGLQNPDILYAPEDGPFAGSEFDLQQRINTDDSFFYQTFSSTNPINENTNPFANPNACGMGSSSGPPNPFPTICGQPISISTGGTSFGRQPMAVNRVGHSLSGMRVAEAGSPADTSVSGPAATDRDVAGSIDLGNLDTSAAEQRFTEGDVDQGSLNGADASVFGLLGGSGTMAAGAQLHMFSTQDSWYLDFGARPMTIRTQDSSGGHTTTDYSSITSASLTHRDKFGDIILGRQRFMDGPVQASLFGSMVREGGREVMDAARVTPDIGKGRKLEVAYIYDAFPRNLPFQVSEVVHGMYGRFTLRRRYANLGVNVLKYQSSPVPDTVGLTGDYSVPLMRDSVELYGEAGRDPFKRDLTSFGLTFPKIFDRTDYDIYVEYADLRSSSSAPRAPVELAVRVYRKVGKNVTIESQLHRFYGTSTLFTLGVAFGENFYNSRSH